MANKKSKYNKKKKNKDISIIIISAILLLLTLILVFFLKGIKDLEKMAYEGLPVVSEEDNYPSSELDSSKFFTDEYGFKGYEDDKYTYKRGIDVSEYQLDIDWARAKEAGVEFAFIRAGYRTADRGKLYKDPYFEKNIEAAKENGILVGVYFFSQAINVDEAKEEAKFVVDAIGDYELDLPVAFDFEEVSGDTDRIANLPKETITECADAFCSVIENYGYDSIIYLNPSYSVFKYSMSQIAHRDIWLAHYTNKTWFKHKYLFWQYSKTGRVDGIDWDVDLDIMIVEK